VSSDKVPSEIAYSEPAETSEGNDWSLVISDAFDISALQASLTKSAGNGDAESSIRWGFQLRADEPRLRCVKLFLDPGQQLPPFISESEIQDLLVKCGKDAVSVVADYLHQVYNHTHDELSKRYGELFMRTTQIQWVLTVPAIWSDAAKDATLAAARRAGLGPELTLISEPEAAAVYTLQAIQPNHLKAGDNFVVCDAGGGTVDLISYEIKQARPLRIEESAEGSGACCGSAMLNAKFEDLIRTKVGAAAFAKLCHEKSRTWLTALKYFEDYVKRNFDPTTRTDYNIPFPGVADDEEAGIEQGFLTLTSQELAEMFRPILNEIIQLVEGQISNIRSKGKSVSGVVLVGGFGQSTCLFKTLKYLGQHSSRPRDTQFEVLKPANAWTAVVRGAVLRGAEGVDLVSLPSQSCLVLSHD
jgi:molecular chaperone DnaK (HSP70)